MLCTIAKSTRATGSLNHRCLARYLSTTAPRLSSLVIPPSSPNHITLSDAGFLSRTSQQTLSLKELPETARQGTTKPMNLFQSINDAMRIALETDDSAILFGEDVAFGGVFRCSMGLQEQFGQARVFNTPRCEQGILGFGVG